jgi:hypothetical protein
VNVLGGSRRQRVSIGAALLRRGWLVLACMVVVAVLAYAVSSVQSSTYTAVAAVAVNPALGGASPGNAQQASGLAITYASAIPHDERLLDYIARTAGPGGTVRAFASPGTAVVTAAYFAPSASQAIAGARALSDGLTGSNHESVSVSTGAVQTIQHPTGAQRIGSQWEAHVVLLVAIGVGPGAGIDADRANKLATTYAGVMSVDDHLMSRAGQILGESRGDIRQHLAVVNPQNTSILAISFKADSEKQAVAGANTVASLVSGPTPAAATIVPGSITILSSPTSAATTSSGASNAIPIGLLIGLALGLVLLIAWERSDPHVSEARELSAQMGSPATAVDQLSTETASALLERWAKLTEHVPARVAVLPADGRAETATEEIVELLRAAGGTHVSYEDRRRAQTNGRAPHGAASPAGDIVLVHAGPPGGETAGEATALNCDLTVVVVPDGMRAADLRSLAEDLAHFGIVPVWSLLAPRRARLAATKAGVGAVAG